MHTHCPHCHARTPPRPSVLVRGALLCLAWTASMAYVFGGILLGPLILFVLPVLIPMGIAMVTAAHGFAFGDRECPACGKLYEMDGRAVAPAPAEHEAGRAHASALAA